MLAGQERTTSTSCERRLSLVSSHVDWEECFEWEALQRLSLSIAGLDGQETILVEIHTYLRLSFSLQLSLYRTWVSGVLPTWLGVHVQH